MKAAALIVGPAGIGLIGLFNNLVVTAGTVGGCGIGSAATRQIASERSRSGENGEATVRQALASATMILGVLASVLFWLLRAPIAQITLGDRRFAGAVGWLSIGVGLTIIASAQTALLAGLRRMTAIAWTYLIGGILATVIGVGALWLFGSGGIVMFVIAVPLASVIACAWFVSRPPRRKASPVAIRQLWLQWRQLTGLGAAIMLGQLLGSCAQLAARGMIAQRMGLAELGLFQAAWAISMTYLGLVLQAMAADYYPRLSEAIHEPEHARRIVNEQTEVGLLLGGPIILAALGLAPLGLDSLYSSAFRPAAELLRWQMLGDVLKIASWPAGYVLLAANRGRMFLLLEGIGWGVFLGATWLLLPSTGIRAPGIAFLLMYAAYLPLVLVAARQTIRLSWSSVLTGHFALLAGAASTVFAIVAYSTIAGAIAGLAAACAFSILGFRKLRNRLTAERAAP